MRKLAFALVALLLIAATACGTEVTGSPAPSGAPTAVPASQASQESSLLLEIASPNNESVITSASIQVAGKTTPDAVVSINGKPVEVNGDGSFSMAVALEEGPNTIEVVASDFQNHKVSRLLTVISVVS